MKRQNKSRTFQRGLIPCWKDLFKALSSSQQAAGYSGKVRDKLFKKGMSIVEYSLLIAVAVAAMFGAQVYIKRAVSGYWRQSGDTFGFGRQYEQGKTNVILLAP